jgi:hypothetical protein
MSKENVMSKKQWTYTVTTAYAVFADSEDEADSLFKNVLEHNVFNDDVNVSSETMVRVEHAEGLLSAYLWDVKVQQWVAASMWGATH